LKWIEGVLGSDESIHGILYFVKSILSSNTTSDGTELIAEGQSMLEFIGKLKINDAHDSISFIGNKYTGCEK